MKRARDVCPVYIEYRTLKTAIRDIGTLGSARRRKKHVRSLCGNNSLFNAPSDRVIKVAAAAGSGGLARRIFHPVTG